MGNICIHTTLMNCPKPPKHEILTITRGATANINFDLTTKVYTINDIDQAIFTFKQGKLLKWFKLIEYFKLTEDTLSVAGKKYYRRENANIPYQSPYVFRLVDTSTQIHVAGFYEECDVVATAANENWQFNNHFYYNTTTDYSWITFTLNPAETKEFKVTEPGDEVEFEVAITLDTAFILGTNYTDSVVIERQHPIAVVDSLYSKL